jgi:hypothetical protein
VNKKKKRCGENEFLPVCPAARSAAVGWEAARPCSNKEVKPAKIDSSIEKSFTRAHQKMFQFLRALSAVRRRAAGWDCRAAGAASEISVRIFAKKSSDFVQYAEPYRSIASCEYLSYQTDFARKTLAFFLVARSSEVESSKIVFFRALRNS